MPVESNEPEKPVERKTRLAVALRSSDRVMLSTLPERATPKSAAANW